MIYDSLNVLIKKFSPDEIAVEELFFNTNITTGIKVAQARGVILLCAVHECGRLYEYTPLMVKQSLTGNGRADKKQIQYMVKMPTLWRLRFVTQIPAALIKAYSTKTFWR